MVENAGDVMKAITYNDHVSNILEYGRIVAPRGKETIEVLGASLSVPVGTIVDRKGMNPKLGYMEMVQFIGGIFDKDAIGRVAPNANLSLFTPQAAYGPRVKDQVPLVIRALKDDALTRRAVLVFPRPEEVGSEDLPCTLSMQFLVRNGQLHTIVTMRSSDVVLGVPYDIMLFSGMIQAIGNCVGVPVRRVEVNFGSAHMYRGMEDKVPGSASRWFEVPAFASWDRYVFWGRLMADPDNWVDGLPSGVKEYEHR